MVSLAALWLPIVLSAVIVFVASSIIHMLLPIHKSDYKKLPDEEAARAALRGVAPGIYMFPACDHKTMKEPAMLEKFKQGPVGTVLLRRPGAINMGSFLGSWFGYCLLISFFVAYLAAHTLAPGTHYLQVFRVVGTAAILAYGLAQIPNGIWGGHPWGVVTKHIIDGVIYGLLTAGTFGWLWPR
jgi:hypothetical protein